MDCDHKEGGKRKICKMNLNLSVFSHLVEKNKRLIFLFCVCWFIFNIFFCCTSSLPEQEGTYSTKELFEWVCCWFFGLFIYKPIPFGESK